MLKSKYFCAYIDSSHPNSFALQYKGKTKTFESADEVEEFLISAFKESIERFRAHDVVNMIMEVKVQENVKTTQPLKKTLSL
jgi:hypothetical protein